MRRHARLYEINARLFLRRVSEKHGRALTLDTVPPDEWQLLARRGFDLIWLMGVWQRSPEARQQALAHADLRQQYDQALPGWSDDDVVGSPYAVYGYRLDPALGGPEALARLRSRLNSLGLGLILDFVPNHLARDHPWTRTHPDRFLRGSEANVRAHRDWFFPAHGPFLAHGRDPYFPPWTDTAQVNFYSPAMRQALIGELLKIAEIADGVRCDMAMLGLNEVFEQVWGAVLGDHPRPESEFWAEAIGQVKQSQPGFLFLAEVYWGLESKLQQIGFDFTYDKGLYDRLLTSNPAAIRNHLAADTHLQERTVRFIENHDERRAVTAFGHERSLAAAAVLTTVPGLKILFDGQLEGKRRRLPLQLGREPGETADTRVTQFYLQLLRITDDPVFHDGAWELTEVASADDESYRNILAWSWRHSGQLIMVAVNYSPVPAQGRLRPAYPLPAADGATFRDELTGEILDQNAAGIAEAGLYVKLKPFQARLMSSPGAPVH